MIALRRCRCKGDFATVYIVELARRPQDLCRRGSDGHLGSVEISPTLAPSHVVFFWMAGRAEIRGIYGWGVLISVAEPDIQYRSFSVKVRYERRFGTPLSNESQNSTLACVNFLYFEIRLGRTSLSHPTWHAILQSRYA